MHITLAKITSVAYLVPIATGLRTMRTGKGRKLHGRVAYTILFLTVITAITGAWMILLSEPLVS